MLPLLLMSQALAVSPLVDVLPLGIGMYVHHTPARGVLYTLTQVGGATAWALATKPAIEAAYYEDDAKAARWQAVLAGTATITLGSYIVSVFDSGHLTDLEAAARKERLGAFSDPRPDLPHVALMVPQPGSLPSPWLSPVPFEGEGEPLPLNPSPLLND